MLLELKHLHRTAFLNILKDLIFVVFRLKHETNKSSMSSAIQQLI